jgi:hypothetical protein
MSSQERQPTRVSVTIGETRRLSEFDFSKVSVSLDRDLAPLENPLDAYRDVNALLSRALAELQAGKPPQISNALEKSSPDTSAARTQQNSHETPSLPASKPAGLTVETLRARLAKWLPDLQILDGFDGFSVKPKRYLAEAWSEVNEVVRSLGGRWFKGQTPKDGSWRIRSDREPSGVCP